MRKLFTVLVAVLLTTSVFMPQQADAQAPQKMSYQAVIRNSGGTLVASTQIGMEINIRQGSPTGTVVYTETQTPTTNANGLVSIEIGGEEGFNTITWGSSTYFIETKIAVDAPLTTYTITGVSQLLSVPYALHAKTAEITGPVIETDPTYTASQAAKITASDIAKLSNLSGKNTGDQDLTGLATTSSVTTGLNLKVDKVAGKGLSTEDYTTAEKTKLAGIATGAEVNVQANWNQTTTTADDYIRNKPTIPTAADGSETKITAGTNVTISGSGTTASPYVVNSTGGTTRSIGQFYQGGKIFWLDATGQHGLIAATADQSEGIQWYNGTFTTTNAVRDGIGAGMYNTERIIAIQGVGSYAAQICANYKGGGYGDWYLPSKHELNLLYLQKDVVGGFKSGYYWSSTERSDKVAELQHFVHGSQDTSAKQHTDRVRAIRAF
jgi:hypothetical protein